jgi:hypothetical protein
MKPLQVDEKAMSVDEFENRLGWSPRVAGIAGDQRLKVSTILPDLQTKCIDLCSISLLGERE